MLSLMSVSFDGLSVSFFLSVSFLYHSKASIIDNQIRIKTTEYF